MKSNMGPSAVSVDDVNRVSSALASFTRNAIEESLWKRPGLSRRDRSLVTVSALLARNQTAGMLHYFNVVLDSVVTPNKLSEAITHLAFYSGRSNAFDAVFDSQGHL